MAEQQDNEMDLCEEGLPSSSPSSPSRDPSVETQGDEGGEQPEELANFSGQGLTSIPMPFPQPTANVIDFSNNRLTEIPVEGLKECKSVVKLDLSKNCLKTLDERPFFEKWAHSLKVLDLSLNQLEEIPPYLDHLPELCQLHLDNNPRLKFVPPCVVYHMVTRPGTELTVKGCVLEEPPQAIVDQGIDALIQYTKAPPKIILLIAETGDWDLQKLITQKMN